MGANLDVLRGARPDAARAPRDPGERAVGAGEFASFLTPDLDSAYLGARRAFAPLRWALRGYWAVVRLLLRAPGPPTYGATRWAMAVM